MSYAKMFSICLAAAITTGGVLLMSPDAIAGQRPIVVTSTEEVVVHRVSFADLNLASDRGAQVLNRRVGSAVETLCIEAVGPDTRSLGSTIATMRCSRGAWDGARPQIARAVERARQIAATGTSTIAATAIVLSIPE